MNFNYSQGLLMSFLFISLIVSCKNEVITETKVSIDSSTEMVNELYAIANNQENINIWHLNKQRALAIDQQIKLTTDRGKLISMMFKSGIEWLNAGEYTTSIERLTSITELISKEKLSLPEAALYQIKEVLAVAYLRKAEIENCIENHNEYSCLLPIDEKGQHVKRDGSEEALKILRELLNSSEANLQTKWLYNITQMTLGGYPDGVEKEFLIDKSIFDSDVDFPRFKEIASSIGIGINDISGSVVMEDFNNDNFLDIMVSSYGLDDQLRYFQNNTKDGFDDLTAEAGLTGLWSGLNMVQADYNNDGWIDIFILRGAWLGSDGNHPNSLLKNNGDGTFTDVTKSAGLYSHFPTQTASWADFNNDGWIDLFVGNEYNQQNQATSELYQNNGDGTFINVAQQKGAAIQGFIKGCVAGDYNNDSHPDLYLSLINNDNYLLENGGPENGYKFTNKALQTKTTEPNASFPCWFFDFDQDGWEDIFVSGFDFSQFQTAAGEVAKDYLNKPTTAELPRLYRNDQNGGFTEVSKEMNVNKVLFTMGCNFGDLNNDGYPDFYAATGTPDFRALIPNRMFLNNVGSSFYDVTTAGGFGHLQKGHGVAFGDLDNDGDQDVYNVLGGSYDGDNFMNALFLNPGNNKNWIKIKLKGTTSNRAAIGAKVKIIALNSSGESKTFHSRLNSGGSFGANPLMIEQGLDDYKQIDRIEIIWPGQTTSQVVKDIQAGSFVLITEGISSAKILSISSMKFTEKEHHHH